MEDDQVRIVELEPQKVAFTHGTGKEIGEPEDEAWEKMMRWVKKNKILEEAEVYHFFGRNNPPPEKEGEEYGYDLMVTIYKDYQPTEEVDIRDMEGGTFAVTRFKGISNFPKKWQELYEWVKNNEEYQIAGHGLEELLTPSEETDQEDMVFDIWLPVKNK